MNKMQLSLLCCLGLFALHAFGKDKPLRSPKHEEIAPARQPVMESHTVMESAKPGQPWVSVHVAFSDQERKLIHEYVGRHPVPVSDHVGKGHGKGRPLPPGLAKKAARGEELPPGWQKKCTVGEVMPREVFDKCHPLPQELMVKLPPPPRDTITVTVSGKIVRLVKATREILDVFDVGVGVHL